MPCTHINHMSDEDVKSWLNSFDTVMTDCDGVLWVGAEAIQGSPQVINRFRELGKRVFFVTNNSTKHRREYKQKVDTLGFGGDLDEIIGTAYLAASYLEDCGFDKTKKVYVVGSAGITQELDDVGIQYLPIGAESSSGFNLETINDSRLNADQLLDRSVEAVILGFDGGINCWKLMMAASYLANHNTQFIVTNADACFLRAGLILPGVSAYNPLNPVSGLLLFCVLLMYGIFFIQYLLSCYFGHTSNIYCYLEEISSFIIRLFCPIIFIQFQGIAM
ncbi:4-nitrophenylphosphatase isoform X5 [Eurytemora carolleeae]|uniref:4-nitrophenylphosphatase isoform X5 n=1 Tax=Eurytemora carolleeae TaxID=1294199 RepID=UPI000C759DB9|nr:4-nitrophenylphosphatase isoform X5 [Eurytemora carolleeae]|eukprot:XP_023330013.1 4-nitrophenylphosphatase-like isoform X5 [Eurytemora affinis]